MVSPALNYQALDAYHTILELYTFEWIQSGEVFVDGSVVYEADK